MAELILYKSNEFDMTYTTACIIKFCEHAPDQAEQCALIVNNTGKYTVKSGSYFDIEEMAYLFENVGLVTKIIE